MAVLASMFPESEKSDKAEGLNAARALPKVFQVKLDAVHAETRCQTDNEGEQHSDAGEPMVPTADEERRSQ